MSNDRLVDSFRPSAMKSISVEIPEVHWADIGGWVVDCFGPVNGGDPLHCLITDMMTLNRSCKNVWSGLSNTEK